MKFAILLIMVYMQTICNHVTEAIPFKMVADENNNAKLQLDCNDANQVFTAQQAKHQFICAPGTVISSTYGLDCPSGSYYDAALGSCRPLSLQFTRNWFMSQPVMHSGPQYKPISWNSYYTPSLYPWTGLQFHSAQGSRPSQCPHGMVFSPSIQLCVAGKADEEKTTAAIRKTPKVPSDCPKGTTFVPAVQLCVSSDQQKKTKTPIKVAGPQKPSDCSKGTTFVPEVQLCVVAQDRTIHITESEKIQPSVSSSENENSLNAAQRGKKKDHKKKCPEGSVFIKDLKICSGIKFPVNLNNTKSELVTVDAEPQPVPQAEEEAQDSEYLSEDQDAEYLSDGAHAYAIDPITGCTNDEVYLSELDICVPFNNCYPYESC